ncbi:spore cortex biosynthesis protein YabQ [Mediterraneibacter gnavus]
MMLGIETEVVIFFYAALTGMVLFCGYQILLLIRRLVRHHPLAVGVEDIGFWLLVSAYVFRQMYCTTYGSIPLVLCSGNRSRAADCCWGAAFVETNFQEIEKNIKNKEILIKTAE